MVLSMVVFAILQPIPLTIYWRDAATVRLMWKGEDATFAKVVSGISPLTIQTAANLAPAIRLVPSTIKVAMLLPESVFARDT